MQNPIGYFEIPVTDLDRAVRFYETVFGYALERETIDGYQMALFPSHDGGAGASGALAKGDAYVPSRDGAIIYFRVDDIDVILQRTTRAGGQIVYAKKQVSPTDSVAEIADSEGNRVALLARRPPM